MSIEGRKLRGDEARPGANRVSLVSIEGRKFEAMFFERLLDELAS